MNPLTDAQLRRANQRRGSSEPWTGPSVVKSFTAELEAALLTEVAKHGSHNQKTHGRRVGGRRGRSQEEKEAARHARRRVLKVGGALLALGTVAAGGALGKAYANEMARDWEKGMVEHRRNLSPIGQMDREHTRAGGFRPHRASQGKQGRISDPGPIPPHIIETMLDRYEINGHAGTLSKAIDTPHRKQGARLITRLFADLNRDYARWLAASGRPDTPESVAEFTRAITGEAASVPVVKSEAHRRFTLAPLYIPDRLDAHAEHTDADTLQNAVWGLIRKGDRSLRLQHDTSITAGEIVEVVSWPYAVEATLSTPDSVSKSARTVTLPPGTVYLGTIWEPWAWKMVLDGKVRGYSMGGTAKRIQVDLPPPKAPA